jgi:predicted transcriptional regulator
MWVSIVRMLAKSVLGELFNRLLKNAASTLFKMLMDKDNNRKAYEFAKELASNKEMSNAEKAKEFNRKMVEWAKIAGRELKESTINCLREFAVSVIKAEAEKISTK